MFRKLSFNAGSSKFAPRSVSLKRNGQGTFGFTVEGGLEKNCLPYVVLTVPESSLIILKGKLKDRAEILEVNGRVVAGDRLGNILQMIEKGMSDTIIISVLDPSSVLSKWKISQLLQSQKPSGRTSEYIEQIRCNVYENTVPVVTRPPRKGEPTGSCVHVTREEFQKLVAEQRLLEWGESPTSGHMYGTLIPEARPTERDRSAGALLPGPQDALEPLVDIKLAFSIVVLRRDSHYAPWGFTLGGGVGTNSLPHVAAGAKAAQQTAWTSSALVDGDSIIAVNGTLVVAHSCAAILELLSKTCACELLCARGVAGTPLTYESVLQNHPTDALFDTLFQQDVREMLFSSSVLHTTHVPVAFPPAGPAPAPFVFVSEHEFNSLAASDRVIAWSAAEDGCRTGVAMPLAIHRILARPSLLHRWLRAAAEAPRELTIDDSAKAGVSAVALPGTNTIVLAAPSTGSIQAGLAITSINGVPARSVSAVTSLLRSPAKLTVRLALDEVKDAYTTPEPVQAPKLLKMKFATAAAVLALLVLLWAVLLDLLAHLSAS
eukprot:m.248554 g.248554  ORF g.248554 m.248554 type:complete len:546 (+) comp15752_c0_seq1:22-1659(+)